MSGPCRHRQSVSTSDSSDACAPSPTKRIACGLEANLRAALGLSVDAPSDQILAATDEPLDVVDLDLVDFLECKRSRCRRTAAGSLEFAEAWRSRQLHALAARIVTLISGPAAPAEASLDEQLALPLAAPVAAYVPRSGAGRARSGARGLAESRPPRGRPGAFARPADRRACQRWREDASTRSPTRTPAVATLRVVVIGCMATDSTTPPAQRAPG